MCWSAKSPVSYHYLAYRFLSYKFETDALAMERQINLRTKDVIQKESKESRVWMDVI